MSEKKRFGVRVAAAPKASTKKESSTFAAFAPVDVKIKTALYDEDNLVEKLISQEVEVWIPLLLVAKDNERAAAYALTFYGLSFVNDTAKFFEGGRYSKDLEGVPIPALCRAISRITSNIVYSNDKGKAYFAFDGLGLLEGTSWTVPVVPKSLNVVKINSEQAVDCQLFCASVTIDSKMTTKLIDGVHQNIAVPYFKKKNCPEKDRIPLKIKMMFQNLVKNVDWDDYTVDDVKAAPWIWEFIAEAVREKKFPCTGIPLQLAYFAFVKQTYDYCPSPIHLNSVVYGNYPRINKDVMSQLNQHSFIVGGKCVKPGHFFNVGIGIAGKKHFGGFVAEENCRYNTHKGVVWESTGTSVESTLLGTQVIGVRALEEFDGFWYDPWKVDQSQLKKTVGLILPYDKKGNGLAALEKWMEKCGIKPRQLHLWATFGPQPLLWVEKREDAAGYSAVAASTLWKSMPVMNLYNFSASLNRNCALANADGDSERYLVEAEQLKAAGVPVDPVSALVYAGNAVKLVIDGKNMNCPNFQIHTFAHDFLPGRHLKKETKIEVTDEAREDFDLYHDFAKDMADIEPEAHPIFSRMPAKRRKAEEPDVEFGEAE